jgi:hypothetical protein
MRHGRGTPRPSVGRSGPATRDRPTARDKLTNDALTPGIFASNVVRNLSLHAGIGHPGVDRAVPRATEQLHRLVGLDVEDPRSTRLYSDTRFRVRGDSTDPDSAGNPVHLVLMVLAAVRVAWSRRLRQAQPLLPATASPWPPPSCSSARARAAVAQLTAASDLRARCAAHRGGMARRPPPARRGAVLLSAAVRPLLYNRLAPLAGKHTIFDTPRADQYFQSMGRPSRRQREYVAALGLLRSGAVTGRTPARLGRVGTPAVGPAAPAAPADGARR